MKMNGVFMKQKDMNFALDAAKERRRLRIEYLKAKRSKVLHDSISDCTEETTERKITLHHYNDSNTIDSKKELRKIRNRESAEASRRRKRDDTQCLQEQVNNLMNQVHFLKTRLGKYESMESMESIERMLKITKKWSTVSSPSSPFTLSNDTLVYTEPAVFNPFQFL